MFRLTYRRDVTLAVESDKKPITLHYIRNYIALFLSMGCTTELQMLNINGYETLTYHLIFNLPTRTSLKFKVHIRLNGHFSLLSNN